MRVSRFPSQLDGNSSDRGEMQAKYLIPNEVVEVVSMQKDIFGVTYADVRHFDGRISFVPRTTLLFHSDDVLLRELAEIICSIKNPARNRRFFELIKELLQREAPLILIKDYVKKINENADEQLELSFMESS